MCNGLRSLHFPRRLPSTTGQTPKAFSGVGFAFRPVFTGYHVKLLTKKTQEVSCWLCWPRIPLVVSVYTTILTREFAAPFLASPIASAQVRNTDDKVSHTHSSKKLRRREIFLACCATVLAMSRRGRICRLPLRRTNSQRHKMSRHALQGEANYNNTSWSLGSGPATRSKC